MTTTIDPESSGPTAHSVGELICDVGRELSSAFDELIAALPESARKPQALARLLDLDKNISHRLVTAIRKGDPLATVHAMPGPEPLRRVTAGARRHFVSTPIAERAERAIGAFESLIGNQGGDRAGLDAIISAWLPDARGRFERLAKQALYRGARQVKGLAADVDFTAHILHPAADAAWCDAVNVFGYLGLRRIRPEASLSLGVLCGSTNPAAAPLMLSGEPIQDPHEVLWRQYCSPPSIELSVYPIQAPPGNVRVYGLKWGDAVGVSSARDVVMREHIRSAIRRHKSPEGPRSKSAIDHPVVVPSKVLVFDVLLHVDLFPSWQPKARIIEAGPRGMADPNDPTRDFDVLPLIERVDSLGQGMARFRAQEIPHYVEMLAEACAARGWSPDSFRGYRTRTEFPVFGSVVQLVIDLPEPPAD